MSKEAELIMSLEEGKLLYSFNGVGESIIDMLITLYHAEPDMIAIVEESLKRATQDITLFKN